MTAEALHPATKRWLPLRRLALRCIETLADSPHTPARLRDAAYLARQFRRRIGHWPNFVAPRSFNEWVLHRLIIDRQPMHRVWNDKLAMRRLVAERLGDGHMTALIAVVDRPEDIPWESLPRGVVFKTSHGSRFNVLVSDLERADREAIAARLRGWLAVSYYDVSREWGYGGIPRRILIEPLLPPAPGYRRPLNVKAFVFGGRVAMVHLLVGTDALGSRLDAFDASGRRLALRQGWDGLGQLPLPEAARERLAEIAARLASGVDFVRLDGYWLDDQQRLLVGELTPYPEAGAIPFHPAHWDIWLGDVWRATRAGAPWPPMPD